MSWILLEDAGHTVTVVDIQWFGNYLKPHPRLAVTLSLVLTTSHAGIRLSQWDIAFDPQIVAHEVG